MSVIDIITTLSDAELLELQVAIPAELESRKKARLDSVRAEIIKLASENGLSEAELGRLLGASGAGSKPRKRSSSKGSQASSPRYQNPSTGEIWSGRGKQPAWLRDALAAGYVKEQFLVAAGSQAQPGSMPAPAPIRVPGSDDEGSGPFRIG